MSGYRVCPYCTRRAPWRARAAVHAYEWFAIRRHVYVPGLLNLLFSATVPVCIACEGRHIMKERRR